MRALIDGDRRGSYWGNNGGWADAVPGQFPDTVQIDFNGSKTIDEINVFTLQDNYTTPSEPTEQMTFTTYGVTAFDVQYFNGASWITAASVNNNSHVWRKITLPAAVTATAIKVISHAAADNGYSRITEIEAWGDVAPPAKTNVAMRSNGATAVASSELNVSCSTWPARGAIDGDRKGAYWSNTGGWADASTNDFLNDSLTITFNGSKVIDEIDVFTVQDNYSSPSEPTEVMTFSLYGLSQYKVEYLSASGWQEIPGVAVSGNTHVWRKFTFAAIETTQIRLIPQAAIDNGYSRVAEIEAWSPNQIETSTVQWLVTDHLGTPRMVFDQSGSLANVKRHDYLPFGEELLGGPPNDPGPGGRTTTQGYAAGDGVRQKFTLKERDNETGLDYFGARYYSSTQGRFASPDEPFVGQDEEDPQTWNLYSYTSGNPLNRIDPDGRRWFYKPGDNGTEVQWVNPNEDGTYTSPGEGWIEFIPTDKKRWLYIWNEDGTRIGYFGEKRDGSPDVRDLWIGKTEDASWDIVGLFIPGKLTFKGILAGASTLWAKHLAKKAATESIEAVARGATEIVAKDGTKIIGFTKHGVNRVIGDGAKRAGTKPEAILDALKNPTKIVDGVDKLGRPYKVYQGANARVVVNPKTGKIVSTNPLSGAGAN